MGVHHQVTCRHTHSWLCWNLARLASELYVPSCLTSTAPRSLAHVVIGFDMECLCIKAADDFELSDWPYVSSFESSQQGRRAVAPRALAGVL